MHGSGLTLSTVGQLVTFTIQATRELSFCLHLFIDLLVSQLFVCTTSETGLQILVLLVFSLSSRTYDTVYSKSRIPAGLGMHSKW